MPQLFLWEGQIGQPFLDSQIVVIAVAIWLFMTGMVRSQQAEEEEYQVWNLGRDRAFEQWIGWTCRNNILKQEPGTR
jgi:hypothetical protein